jgi:carbamoylphosphate synthase large subunit
MTWNIRFGHKEDWRGWIEMTINRSRFRSQFGNLDLEDFTNFDCVVPLQLADYAALQNKNNEGFLGQKFWSPNPNVVDLCDDKLVLNRFLLGGEFAQLVPPLRESNNSHFPYIVKKRRDTWGQNSFIVRNAEDERALATTLQSPEYFCQTYISGAEEFALHMLLINNEVVYAKTIKHEMQNDYCVMGARNKSRMTYLEKSEHLAIFSRILAGLGFTGTCCINYKMHNGLPMLFEINPRFGASLSGDINRYLEAYLISLGIVAGITRVYWVARRHARNAHRLGGRLVKSVNPRSSRV